MRRNPVSLNLLTVLTRVTLAAALGLAVVIFLLLLFPGLVPGFLRAPTPPALVSTLGPEAVVAYPTLPPEWTPTPPRPSPTPRVFPTWTAAPSQTPFVVASPLPNLNSTAEAGGADARVRADAGGLRLRAFPGSAGQVTAFLDALTPLDVVGRTPDNVWLEVITPDQQSGWVMAEFLEVYVDLVGVPLTAGAALQASPTPIAPDEARVAPDGDNLRLRQAPGTAGLVIANLPAGMVLDLVGRTEDNAWLEVITSDRQHGWVMARYVEVLIDLAAVPVTGTAVDATAAASASRPPPTASLTPRAVVQVTPSPLPSPTAVPPTPLPPTPVPPTANPPTMAPPTQPPPAPGTGGYVDAPYVSGISPHVREIFQAGQARGNQANVFAKVGDSITISPQFLYPIGSGQYDLRGYGHLAEAAAYFRAGWARTGNPFSNVSLAAKGGWSSYSVLSPSLADHSLCRASESPLACEYRLSRPSIALVMLGTNDVMGTSGDAFRAYMQRVAQDSVAQGVIPVFSTIPPFQRAGYEARVGELNAIIREVAQAHEVPVWDYWAALQSLANYGLSPDGVHPSQSPGPADFTPANLQYGYTVRNLLALQVLDAIWRTVTAP